MWKNSSKISVNYFKFAVINWLHYKAEGNNPFFVNTCDKDISAQEIHDRFEELEGKDVCIAGRIMSWRDMGKASFMDIHDRSGRMQVYLKNR